MKKRTGLDFHFSYTTSILSSVQHSYRFSGYLSFIPEAETSRYGSFRVLFIFRGNL